MLIPGMFDSHVHPAPDVGSRKFTDAELATRLSAAGFGGAVLKNHWFETASRARNLRDAHPDLCFVGGIVLNGSVGGLNPIAVQRFAEVGGGVVWMPTMDARAFHVARRTEGDLDHFISVLDADGDLVPQAVAVLELIGEHDLILATGHLSAQEGTRLIEVGRSIGLRKMIVTHADNPTTNYTVAQQQHCANLGAFIEHSYFMVFYERTGIAQVAAEIRAVGADQVIIDTDMGQPTSPYPDEGLAAFCDLLAAEGLDEADLTKLVRTNPRRLLGID